jgi:hypothetical protein
MKHYETTAGYVTRGDTFAQINEKLIELQELCAVMAHLHNLQDNTMDTLLARGWLGMSELYKRTQQQVIQLAKRGMH